MRTWAPVAMACKMYCRECATAEDRVCPSAKCAAMADMTPDGFLRMLCVEAAQVFQPVGVPKAGRWQGWQRLRVVA